MFGMLDFGVLGLDFAHIVPDHTSGSGRNEDPVGILFNAKLRSRKPKPTANWRWLNFVSFPYTVLFHAEVNPDPRTF